MDGGERADGEEPAVGARPRDGRAGPSALASCSACRAVTRAGPAETAIMRVMSLGVTTPARCPSLKTSARRSAHSVRRGSRVGHGVWLPDGPGSCELLRCQPYQFPSLEGTRATVMWSAHAAAPQPRHPQAKVPLAAAG